MASAPESRPPPPAGEGERPPEGPWSVVGKAAGILAGFVTGAALVLVNEALAARLLGVQTYGLFALAYAVAKVSEKVSLLGLNLAVQHFVPVFQSENDRARLKGVIAASLAISAAVAATAVAIVWALAPWLAHTAFEKPGSEPFIRQVILAVPFMVLTEMVGNVTYSLGHVRYYILARTLAPPVLFGSFIIGLWITHADVGLIAPALVLAYAIALGLAIFGLGRSGTEGLARERGIYPVGELLRYALPIVLAFVLWIVLSWTDLLALGVFRSAAEVGIYRACMQIIAAFDMVTVAINASSARIYATSAKQGDNARLGESYRLATRWLSVVAIPALMLVLVNTEDLLRIMGPAFAPGWPALTILAVAAFLHCYFGAAGFLLMVSGRQAYELANAAVAATVSVVLNILLVPAHGLVGAATATATALLVMNAMRFVEARRLFRVASIRGEVLRAVAIGIASAALVHGGAAALGFPQGSGVGPLVLRIAAILGLFYLLYWRFGLSPAERERLHAFLQSRLR